MQGKDVKETTTELVDAARKPLATIKVNAGGLTGQLDFRRPAPVNPNVLTSAVDPYQRYHPGRK